MPVGILNHITVIECATFMTGPYATALLADLGARMIKELATDERFKTRDVRRQNYHALEQTLVPTLKTRTRDEWLKIPQAEDVPAAPLCNVAEVLDDPQVNHLNRLGTIEHLLAGALRYDGFEKTPPVPPPLVDQHSRKILHELGYDSDLQSRGVTKTLWLR